MKALSVKAREGLVQPGHYYREDYRQRCERKVWSYILLYERDRITVEGRQRQLVAKNLGAGVWEITKAPLTAGTS
ncbi:hypothetical protein LCGC14_0263780 [marine sediment metagenome]|uniref:Uncharacterized protein n=1 Tax=marine sediment metagenome TaxID=412755 RepID=A0A0F9U5E3_9ZZZZ